MNTKVSPIPTPPFKTAFLAEQAFYLAFVRKDIKLMEKVWANTVTTYCLHPAQQPLVGTTAIMNSWQQVFSSIQTTQLKIEHQNIGSDKNLAVHRVTEHISMKTKEKTEQQATIHSINTFQCINNNWYMISHHSAPAPEIVKPQGTVIH